MPESGREHDGIACPEFALNAIRSLDGFFDSGLEDSYNFLILNSEFLFLPAIAQLKSSLVRFFVNSNVMVMIIVTT